MGMIEEFNQDQSRALLVLAFHMMVADHEAVPPEQALVDQLEAQLGIEGTLGAADLFVRPDTSLFAGFEQRVTVLAKLAGVALADGRKHVNEMEFLLRLADDFGLDGETLARIVAWAASPAGTRPALAEFLRA